MRNRKVHKNEMTRVKSDKSEMLKVKANKSDKCEMTKSDECERKRERRARKFLLVCAKKSDNLKLE